MVAVVAVAVGAVGAVGVMVILTTGLVVVVTTATVARGAIDGNDRMTHSFALPLIIMIGAPWLARQT
jgi:hypothetical protein